MAPVEGLLGHEALSLERAPGHSRRQSPPAARSNLNLMRDVFGPPLRAAAATCFLAGCLWMLLDPPSLDGLETLIGIVCGTALIAITTAWLTTRWPGRVACP